MINKSNSFHENTLEWHPYRMRVRDLVLLLYIYFSYLNLFMHWDSYGCGCGGNVGVWVVNLLYVGRLLSMHFHGGSP